MKTNTLITEQLIFGHSAKQGLFEPLDFCCSSGEITAILGSNGCGKTTLLHTLLGTLPLLHGQIQRHGTIGFVPQIFAADFHYSVLDIVLMGRAIHLGIFSLPGKQDVTIALDALATLNIAELAEHAFYTLSGGQRQLVLIARALAMQCDTLILDEPTASLDLYNQSIVLQLIKKLAQQQISLIFTTHDPAHALAIADNVLLLLKDKKHLFGTRNTLLTEKNLSYLYHIPIKQVSIENAGQYFNTLVPLLINQ